MKADYADRFWAKVQKTDNCWIWTSSRTPLGYGTFYANGGTKSAHRIAYKLSYGDIPDGKCVLHHCDRPACVRPDHLFVGTQFDNMQDMTRKGRGKLPEPSKRVTNGNAKLTAKQAEQIRMEYCPRKVTRRMLAEKYGVAVATIGGVIYNHTWQTPA